MSEIGDLNNKRLRDFTDQQVELAGLDVGRMRRFQPNAEHSAEGKRKKREREAFQNRLMELLADPAYRTKYDGVMEAINAARAATERALDQILDRLTEVLAQIQRMEADAARLPDGSMVFRDESGTVRRADGSEVESHLADTILWTGFEPSFEDYNGKTSERDSLQAKQAEVQRYETEVIGSALDKMTDTNNPQSADDLDAIAADISANMPNIVRERMPAPPVGDRPEPAITGIALPSLGTRP